MAAIEGLAEEVATNLEEVAQATRKINAPAVGYVLGGLVIGAALGFYWGRRWNREKIQAQVYAEGQEEIQKIREVYFQKAQVAEPKPTVEEVMEQRGYSTAVVEAEEAPPRPTRPPVPVREPLEPPIIVKPPTSAVGTWDYAVEMRGRSDEHPYVIHQDEFNQGIDGYSKVTYTYYAVDDVLCDEDNRPLPHADLVVGQDNLKFGYGADDEDVVFVRNQKLELEMEICRIPASYEEEVLGLERNDPEPD